MSDMLHSLYDLEVKVTNRNSISDIGDAIVQLPDQGRGLRLCILGNINNTLKIIFMVTELKLKGYCTVFQHALKSLEITSIVLS